MFIMLRLAMPIYEHLAYGSFHITSTKVWTWPSQIWTKFGTHVVFVVVWNHTSFEGHMSYGFPNKSHWKFCFFKICTKPLTIQPIVTFSFFVHGTWYNLIWWILRGQSITSLLTFDLRKNAALNFFIFFHVVVWGIGKLQYKFYYGAPLGLGDINC